MAYTRNWDVTDPADADEAKYGAQEIREFKTDVEERIEAECVDIDNDPLVRKHLRFNEQTTAPTAVANQVIIFGQDDGAGETILRARNNTANYHVILLASGIDMLFYEDAAPVMWTIQNTLDDKLLFVTKGSVAGGETGGGAHSTGTWTLAGLTNSSESAGAALLDATLHGNNLHITDDGNIWYDTDDYELVYAAGTPNTGVYVGKDVYKLTQARDSAIGNHTHTISSNAAWRPAAYCAIIATKD